MTRYGIAIVGIAVICCTIGFIEGRWIYAMAIAVEVVAIVFSDIMSPRVDAKKDLREVYPPKRDRFHRDLERLNKLRGASAAASPPDLATAQRRKLERKRTAHLGYVDVQAEMEHERSFQSRRRRTIAGPTYGAILEGFRDVCAYILWVVVMTLVVVAVVGAFFLLGMGIGSLL